MKEHNRHTLKGALKRLPHYKAPDKVWNHLQEELSPNIVRGNLFPLSWKLIAVAAGVVLALGFGGYFVWTNYFQAEKPYRIEAEQSIEKNIELEPVKEIYIDDSIQVVDSLSVKP